MAAVVLAAGQSRRMERFKPLLPLGKESAVERTVHLFLDAGLADIIVVTGHRAAEIHRVLAPLKVRCIENPDHLRGMFSSVMSGVRALSQTSRAFFVHPADIPLVRAQTVQRLAAEFDATEPAVLYPTFDGRRGHPTLIRRDLLPRILAWHGAGGLRACLGGYAADSRELPVADEAVLLDMDTEEDYRALLARLRWADRPSEAECRVLMDTIQALPPPVAAHCRAVSAVARRLAEALKTAGAALDPDLAQRAALLHDIARTSRDHAAAGARLLESHGFPRMAPIVARHMDLTVDAAAPVDETQIVFLADKLVAGDRLVNLEERFARKMVKYGQDPAAAAAIARRRENARRVRDKIENLTGRSVNAIATGSERQ